LFMIANLVEFYDRLITCSEFWDDYAYIIGGCVLECYSTWMGISDSGKIEDFTNYLFSELDNHNNTQCVEILFDYFINTESAEEYLTELTKSATNYNGFNLISGTVNQLYYYSNQINDYYALQPGTYGLSNHLLNTPWPKVTSIKSQFNTYIESNSQIYANDL